MEVDWLWGVVGEQSTRAETIKLWWGSLVYSGGKSIHGLVEISATDVDAWGKAIDKLLYAVANPNASEAYRADRACKNPDRLTRLAGAMRPDKGTTQSLLWLASP